MDMFGESMLRFGRDMRERLMPRLQSSHFEKLGILTPEEFVLAGDNLVGKFPGVWKWGGGIDPRFRKAYLPAHKQFVYMQGACCNQRVNDAASAQEDSDWQAVESVLSPGDGDDDDEEAYRSAAGRKKPIPVQEEEEKQKQCDLVDLLFDLEDPSVVADFNVFHNTSAAGQRKYDVSLTYDNFYRVPRAYMFGYHSSGSPLSHQQMFGDVLSEYQFTTCTVEPHPHLSTQMLSIHPCKHSHAMLRLIEAQKAVGRTPTVDSYLILFLKFIQSVVPMIEYDFGGSCKVKAI